MSVSEQSPPQVEWFLDGELWRCRECNGVIWHNGHGDRTYAELTCEGCGETTRQNLLARCHEGGVPDTYSTEK